MTRRLVFDQRGSGSRPVLLLHGFLGSGRNLASLARRLVEHDPGLRCVFPDLTGHGSSPALPPEPTLAHVAQDVLTLASELSPNAPIDVIGHSFGGRTALAAKALSPTQLGRIMLLDIGPGPIDGDLGGLERVLGLVLAAPPSAPSRDAMRRYFVERGISAPLTEWVILNLTQSPTGELAWRIDRAALAALNESSRREGLWTSVDGSVGCVRGAKSSFVSDTAAARMAALGCGVHTLAGAGHFVHVDALGALAAHLGTWLGAA